MFRLIKLTIKEFVFNHKILFSLIFILQLTSLIAVFLISAIMTGRIQQENLYNNSVRSFDINFNEIQQKNISNEIENNINNSIRKIENIKSISSVSLVSQDNKYMFDYIYSPQKLFLGRYFNENEIRNSEQKIIAGNDQERSILINDKITIYNRKYTVIGISHNYQHLLPYNSEVASYLGVKSIRFKFDDIPTKQEKTLIYSILSEKFNDAKIDFPQENNSSVYNDPLATFMFSALFILSLINITFLYQYLLNKRNKQIIIMKLCGATRFKCVLLFILEILFFSIILFVISCFISTLIMPYIVDFTTSGNYSYTFTYSHVIYILIIYIIAILAVFLPFLIKCIKRIEINKI